MYVTPHTQSIYGTDMGTVGRIHHVRPTSETHTKNLRSVRGGHWFGDRIHGATLTRHPMSQEPDYLTKRRGQSLVAHISLIFLASALPPDPPSLSLSAPTSLVAMVREKITYYKC